MAAVLAVAAASIYGSYVVLIPAVIIALVAFATSWKSLLPRQVWEDPSVVGVNRLATHSRLGYYTTFKEAAACGQSPNVVSLRSVLCDVLVRAYETGSGRRRDHEPSSKDIAQTKIARFSASTKESSFVKSKLFTFHLTFISVFEQASLLDSESNLPCASSVFWA